MEIVEYQEEEDHQPSCALGGPIFVPNLIGPLTAIQEFKFSIIQGLHALEAELLMDSTTEFDDELSVDELKVLSEEELVDKAFKEACKDTELIESSLQIPEDNSNEIQANGCQMPNNEIACLENSRHESNTTKSHESLNESRLRVHSGNSLENMDQQGSKKRKRKGRNLDKDNHFVELESVYLERVEELAKIKQKQDEDKAAARLHSFNVNTVEGTISVAEKVEKMRSLRFISSAMKVKSSSTHEYVPMNNPETVLSIEIYHNSKTHTKTQEFLVLGRHTLSEFRDKIYCMTDQLMRKAGQHDPSGYFLIEDMFCNDLRDPAAIDYSEPIFNWLKNRKEEALEKWECITISGDPQKKNKALFGSETIAALPQFKASEMHKTRFCDLRFRLGSGYLYCHQGDCRHIMVIRDMRLIHPDDVQNQATYPIVTFQLQARWRKCSVCRTFRATKVTLDDKWAEDNPCYFCESCYFLLHYSEDGSLLYNEFEVYDYHLEV